MVMTTKHFVPDPAPKSSCELFGHEYDAAGKCGYCDRTIPPLPSYKPAPAMGHIRAKMPRKGGNSFYRDKNDYTKFCVSLCGAPVTDKDIDFFTAGTKKFKTGNWPTCPDCVRLRG
jgi:hypothetical protein